MDTKLIVIVLLILIIFLIALNMGKGEKVKKENTQTVLNWVNSVVYLAGFEYDKKQGIYTTRIDAMQRIGGYNTFYDDLSTLLFMVIDVEPIKFKMGGKDFMIEMWKGQYYASTGCEIGLYHYIEPTDCVSDKESFKGLYECAYDDEMLQMEYDLVDTKTKKTIFSRSGKHWWLTGFKPGIYHAPEDLALENIKITFKNNDDAKNFYTALNKLTNAKDYKASLNGSVVSYRWTIASPESQPKISKGYRDNALCYNKNLAAATDTFLDGNFDPDYINTKVLDFKKFLEADANIYVIVRKIKEGFPETPFSSGDLCKSNNSQYKLNKDISCLLKNWDAKNGTELSKIDDLLGYISGRIALYWGGTTTGLKLGCKAVHLGVPKFDENSLATQFCNLFFPAKKK